MTRQLRARRVRIHALAPLAIAMALGVGGPPRAIADEVGGGPVDDQAITWAVERELLHDQAVPSNRIAASTSDGIVTLIGSVDNVLAKNRAADIARLVKGVRSVVDDIKVHPRVERTDAELAVAVERALLDDPATDSYEISAVADHGHVTLAGRVASWPERELGGKVACSVSGVTSCTNDIEVAYDKTRSDGEIQAEIEESMAWDALIDDGLVDVRVKNHEAVLSGTVGSAAERQRARNHAWTAGVRAVDDSALEVARWARDDDLRSDKYTAKDDADVERAAEQTMDRDPRVRSYEVEVAVRNGVATLTGIVDNLKAKRAAAQDLENTVGVFSVVDLIKVRAPDGRTDQAIESDVVAALKRDPNVDRFEISADAHDGVVTLTGTVDTYFEKGLADDLASRTKGVEEVRNHLDVLDVHSSPALGPLGDSWRLEDFAWYEPVPSPERLSDQRLERAVENELFWSPFVSASDIQVSVLDGVVTLEGKVDSWREWGAARDNALQAGARRVRDLVTVDSGS